MMKPEMYSFHMVNKILLNWIMVNGLYEDMKMKAEKRVEWKKLSLQWKTCPWAEHYDWLTLHRVLPHATAIYSTGGWCAFEQDNARPHAAAVRQRAFRGLHQLPWPARFSYLSPYEHVWDMKRELTLSREPATTIAELRQQVQDACNHLSQDDFRHLYDGLYARLHVCAAARSTYTVYWSDFWAPLTVPHGRLARWRKWKSCDVGEAKEGLENELWRRWSNGRVGEWVLT